MKIFVTGGNGFIGSHLVAQLVARGDTVICLVREPNRAPALQALGAHVVRGDITERASIKDALRGADAVLHLAGMYKLGRKFFSMMHAINVDGARNVLETAAELGMPKIIHTSTVGVFGNTLGKIVDETYKVSKEILTSAYERTKWEAHYEVAVPLQQKGAPIIITQPGLVTGAGDPSPHIQQVDLYLQRTPIGFGANAGITWAHVDDIADGHIRALARGKPGEAYILAGPACTWKQLMESWEPLTGIPAPKIWAPNWMINLARQSVDILERMGINLEYSAEGMAALVDYTFWGTANKAKRELEWQPRPIDETSRDVLEYEMKKRGMKRK